MTGRAGSAHVASMCIFLLGVLWISDKKKLKNQMLATRIKHNDCSLPIRGNSRLKTQQGLLSNPGQAWESRV